MNFNMLLLVTVGLLASYGQAEMNQKCYKARICFHTNHEKCGVNGQGQPRRFLDLCDMQEYNCLKNTDYSITLPDECKELPPIDESLSHIRTVYADLSTPFETAHKTLLSEYWCWRGKYCHTAGPKVCGIDRRLNQTKYFPNECTMYKSNCLNGQNYALTNMKQCSKRRRKN